MLREFTTWFLTATPVLVSLFSFIRGFKGKYDKERYEQVVFPSFSILEPHLYHPLDSEVEYLAKEVTALIIDNRAIAGGRLLNYADHYRQRQSQCRYNNLCDEINNEYDRLSRRLGIPRRPLAYKIRKRQYRSVFSYAFFYGVMGLFAALILSYIVILIKTTWLLLASILL